MGVNFIEAAIATANGPQRRSKPLSSASSISGWTLPPAETANSGGATSSASTTPQPPRRASSHVTSAVPVSRMALQPTATTSRGRYVSGTHSTAYHGAYQYEFTATSPAT